MENLNEGSIQTFPNGLLHWCLWFFVKVFESRYNINVKVFLNIFLLNVCNFLLCCIKKWHARFVSLLLCPLYNEISFIIVKDTLNVI